MFKTISCTNRRRIQIQIEQLGDNGRNCQKYGTCMQQHLFEHFSEDGHHSFLEDASITSIAKTDPSNPLQRKNYWRSTLKAVTPWGLKVEDCV